jgi:protein involved in polysaccharide export with SLBB domain
MGLVRTLVVILVCLFGTVAFSQAPAVVKPGDSVKVTCDEEPSLSKVYTITRDGYIVMQFIGAVSVGGLSEGDAAAKIAATLIEQRILHRATVKLEILGVASGGLISYSGAVTKAGEAFPREGMRLSDIVKEAQPTAAADLTKVRIVQPNGNTIVVNFELFDGKNFEHNPEVRPGDKVIFDLVVGSPDISVVGLVKRPGVVPYKRGITVKEVIKAVGGVATHADTKRIRVERDTQQLPLVSLEGEDFVLLPGDRVFVPELAPSGSVSAKGAINNPASFAFREGMTLVDVIRTAGGPKKNANLHAIKIHRIVEGKTVTQTIDLQQVGEGKIPDPLVQNGDVIEIPAVRKKGFDLKAVGAVLVGIVTFGLVKF